MSIVTTLDRTVADLNLNIALNVLVDSSVFFIQKNSKAVKKTCKKTEQKALKQRQNADKLPKINIPIAYNLEKYLLYNLSSNTISQSIV